ncbi:hypothetical protein RhiirA4_472114 [Rhizophagus irregularis]|uniref:Uncharacterized protein n=1 Tax=Rhizophagus irregularis TaxID=588596 RepID=A0A2I1H4D6_9GLOM|nr:hypothetical protein RhiirA4_472114 [Rhizophagus irregularis]
MACLMDPKVGPNGEHLKWDPMQIPSTKPFVNISTSAEEPLTSYEDMNFVKTRSLIYSPFHQTARYINFEVGYSKDAKWFDSLNDKWGDYANFFVGGFLEAIYSTNDKTYAQIDAKLIDYDVRFRHQNHQTSITTSPRKPVNTFALRRNESASRSVSSPRTSSIIIDDTQEFDDSNKRNSIVIDDDEPAFQSTTDNNELSKFVSYYKKFKESEKQDQSSRTTPSTAHSSPTPTYRSQKRKLSDLCNLEESDNDPDNDPNDLGNNPGNGNDPGNDPDNDPDNDSGNDPGNDPVNDPVNDPFRLECTYDRQGSGRGGRGRRGGKGGRGGRGGRGQKAKK